MEINFSFIAFSCCAAVFAVSSSWFSCSSAVFSCSYARTCSSRTRFSSLSRAALSVMPPPAETLGDTSGCWLCILLCPKKASRIIRMATKSMPYRGTAIYFPLFLPYSKSLLFKKIRWLYLPQNASVCKHCTKAGNHMPYM